MQQTPLPTTDNRRQRYEDLLHPLTHHPRFSRDDLPDLIQEPSSGFVTRTLNEVVRAGVLQIVREGEQTHYEWTGSEPTQAVQAWIQQRLHGDQVKEQPEQQRPRERLLRDGAVALSDADLLAILIRVGVVGESATTGGSKLANHFHGRIDQIRDAGIPELRSITKSVTKASYCQIMAALEIGRRAAKAAADRTPVTTRITSTVEAIHYCESTFAYLAGDAVQEEFHIVTLDTKHKPIANHRITVGTLDSSLVHPREVFRPAIRDAAAAVLMVHNHPSGDPTPSREDHAVTKRLTEAGKLIGIQVLDHVIVARDACLSLRDSSV
ncbi:MAG: DNA repair protein RadC [Planctomycetota bacterium]